MHLLHLLLVVSCGVSLEAIRSERIDRDRVLHETVFAVGKDEVWN